MKLTKYRHVITVQGIRDYLTDAKTVAFDFETAPDELYRSDAKAALDPAKSHIVGCSFSVEEGTGIYVPIAHIGKGNMDEAVFYRFLGEFLSSPNIIKIAHNIAFESMMAYKHGIVIQLPVYDTIAAAQMTLKSDFEFRSLADSGLKKLAATFFDEPLPSFADVTCGKFFDELPAQHEETVRYGAADSDFALRLYHTFNEWFDRYLPKHRWIVENIESPTAVYLGIMKYNGVPVDRALMEQRKKEAAAEKSRIRKDIAFLIGDVDIGANCSTTEFKKYLFESQGLPILKTTGKAQAALDDMAMVLLGEWCEEHKPELVPLFKLVQEYRKWGKIQSTYIDGYLKYLNSVTGRLHPEFFSLGTDTGRMSCQKPNVQNCFDDKTEILTKRGFIKFADLKGDDVVAQWEKGEITFVRPLEHIVHRHDGDLVYIYNQHIDLMVTPNHRCLVENRKSGNMKVVSADNYPNDAKQLHGGNYTFGKQHLSEGMIILLVATQADGNIHDGGIDFVFSKARKYRRLLNTLTSLNVPFSDTVKKSGQVRIRIKTSKLAANIIDLLTERKVWGKWLLDYDKETIMRIIEELPHWDGCFTRNNHYSSSVKENADWMQILYVLTNTRAHLRKYWNGNPNSKINYQVDIVNRNYSLTTNVKRDYIPYQGNVYCVAVPSSFIVVRRNGQVMVTGNCPRKTNDPVGVRNFIKTPKGHLILSLDFSQIELRVGAFYCRDERMMETYRTGGDIHAATTSVIFGVTYEEAQDKHRADYKEQRTIAKNVNFGTFYGLFPKGLQNTLKFKAGVEKTVSECEGIIANLKAGYKGLSVWQEETKRRAALTMYSETWLGRRRYLPGIRSKNWSVKSFTERCSLNTPIQGTAADILKLAIARILKGLPERPWIQPILQIHDELTFIIPKEKLTEAVAFIRGCMEEQPFPEFDLPLIAEASAGETFGTMEELD